MGAWTWALLVVCALLLLGVVASCVSRVRRLDRLHVRTDAARAGLDSALRRRADATLAVAAALEGREQAGGSDPGASDALRRAVAAVPATGVAGVFEPDREAAENRLGRRLATVDRSLLPVAVRAELVEAAQLVVLARRVHNDAVRDTLVLRSRRLVRWLHLAGTAPLPAYFEIADAESVPVPPAPGGTPLTPTR